MGEQGVKDRCDFADGLKQLVVKYHPRMIYTEICGTLEFVKHWYLMQVICGNGELEESSQTSNNSRSPKRGGKGRLSV